MLIYINGEFVEKQEARVSVFDHGLLYGDGVFEGISFYNGRIFRHIEHIERLYDSALAICLEIPVPKEKMMQAVRETIVKNNLKDGYVRLIITRGIGGLGLNPFTCDTPSVIIIAGKISLYPRDFYQNGLEIITCSIRRSSQAGLSPAIKSLNYLPNILAKIEASNANCHEAIMLNEQGLVAECTGDNIFIIKGEEILTPPIYAGALAGITRAVVIELIEQTNLKFVEKNMSKYDVYTADECFLTGTAAEIIPVVSVDRRKIGEGTVGEITQTIAKMYRKLVNSEGDEIY